MGPEIFVLPVFVVMVVRTAAGFDRCRLPAADGWAGALRGRSWP